MDQATLKSCMDKYTTHLAKMVVAYDKGDMRQAEAHKQVCNTFTAMMGY